MFTLFRRWFGPLGPPLALVLIFCIGGPAARLYGADPERRSFALAAGEAEKTLEAFSDQADVQIVFLVGDVRGVKTQPVRGTFAIREALDRLIAHTELRVEVEGKTGAYVIKRDRIPRPASTPSRTANPATDQPMKQSLPVRLVGAFLALTAAGLEAQTASTPAQAAAEEAILLTPFTVNTGKDTGYVAGSSLSGGRADTPLKLTPAAISVMTREFMDDLNLLDSREAANWMLNATPNNEQQNLTPFGSFGTNIRNAGGATPMRNYFLFYAFVDSYNTERLETARGPNSLLFGDGSIGGMVSNFTKVARFGRKQNEVRLQGDTYGGWRSSLDSQWGNDRFAVRANVLVQRNEGWRADTFENRDGVFLTASFKVGPRTQLRADVEALDRRGPLFSTTYADNLSFWNGTTFNDNNTTIAGPNNFGLEQIGGTAYQVFIPGNPSAGVQDWRLSYRTRGTGIPIVPEGRSDIRNFPGLPSREFNLGPNNAEFHNNFRSRALYLDQRLSENWFAQLAWAGFDQDTGSHNSEVVAGDARIDVNRLLPDGRPNSKFGVRFADVDQRRQYQDNTIDEVRLLSTYKLDLPRAFDLRQRFAAIVSYRPETFEMWTRSFRRTDNPAVPNVGDIRNQVRYRYYWDEPSRYGISEQSVIPGQNYQFVDTGFASREHKTLTTFQVVSTSTFLNERVSLIAGARRDSYKRELRSMIGTDPVTGLIISGGYDPTIKANRVGYTDRTSAAVTKSNIGTVGYVFPWLALQANYSENFNLPSSGVNKIDGSTFGPPLGKGTDLGLKFSLPNNRLYGTISYYKSTQTDRIVGSANLTEIRRIWTNLGSTDTTKTELNYRDVESLEVKGWEVEFVANPIPNVLRFRIDYARPQTAIIESRPGLQGYVAANLAEWTAGANNPGLAGAAQIASDINTLRNAVAGIVKGATQNNTYRDLGNVYGTYSFVRGPLKNLEVGAGANYRGERKVGNRDARILYGTNSPTATQSRDAAFAYLYAPRTVEASMHASYTYRLANRRSVRLQLNVTNLLDNRDLVTTNYGVYNTGGIAANPLNQTNSGFYYLNPRKFTLSTTVNF